VTAVNHCFSVSVIGHPGVNMCCQRHHPPPPWTSTASAGPSIAPVGVSVARPERHTSEREAELEPASQRSPYLLRTAEVKLGGKTVWDGRRLVTPPPAGVISAIDQPGRVWRSRRLTASSSLRALKAALNILCYDSTYYCALCF
jgi:hypothetical protein